MAVRIEPNANPGKVNSKFFHFTSYPIINFYHWDRRSGLVADSVSNPALDSIFAIPGVQNVDSEGAYCVSVTIGSAFDWTPIEDEITRILA